VLVTAILEELLDLLLETDEVELFDLLIEDATRLDLDTALDLLLEDTGGFELEVIRELNLPDVTVLETALEGVCTTGSVDNDETDLAELMLLKFELSFELESDWFSSDTEKLFTDDASLDAWFDAKLVVVKLLDVGLLEFDVSAFSGLLKVDLLDPSRSTPAAPPQAVNTIVKITPQKGSLAIFSAEENIFYTIRYLEFCVA
jgi:hypothetical protein